MRFHRPVSRSPLRLTPAPEPRSLGLYETVPPYPAPYTGGRYVEPYRFGKAVAANGAAAADGQAGLEVAVQVEPVQVGAAGAGCV